MVDQYGGINVLTVDLLPDLIVQRMVEQWKNNNPEPEAEVEIPPTIKGGDGLEPGTAPESTEPYFILKKSMFKVFDECKENAKTRIPKPLPSKGVEPVLLVEKVKIPAPKPLPAVDSRLSSPDQKKGGKRSKSIDKKGDKGKKSIKEEPPLPPPNDKVNQRNYNTI